MSLSRLRSGEWLAGISGAALVVSLFVPWYGVDGCLASADCENRTAFDAFSGLDVLLLIAGGLGIAVLVATAFQGVPAIPLAFEALITPVVAVAAVLAIRRLVDPPFGYEVDLRAGAWLGTVAAVCLAWGVWRAMRSETGAYPAPHVERIPSPPKGTS
jgi:hypothetical protein